MRIDIDPMFSSVSVYGNSYNHDGSPAATWKSVMARVDPVQRRVLYHWQGWHSDPAIANVPFHGFGEIEFVVDADAAASVSVGQGKFWNVDEAHPS